MPNARSQKAKEFLRRVVPVAPDATLEFDSMARRRLKWQCPPPKRFRLNTAGR